MATLLVWWGAFAGPPVDERAEPLFEALPDWLRFLAWIAYSGSGLYALALFAAAIAPKGPAPALRRDSVVAVVGVIVVSLAAGRSVRGAWPDVIPELAPVLSPGVFPAFRLALVLAVVLVQVPYLTLPQRRVARRIVLASAVGTLLLGLTTVTGVVAGTLIGVTVAAGVAAAFGSPAGLPSIERLSATLAAAGLQVSDLRYEASADAVGRAVASWGDRPVEISVFGRDAADSQRAERLWKALWYRSQGPSSGASPVQQLEHEAFLLERAQGTGCAPQVLAAMLDERADAVLVLSGRRGRALSDVGGGGELAATGSTVWACVRALHDAGIVHGAISPDTVTVGREGEIELIDFGHGAVRGSGAGVEIDLASTLLTLAAVSSTDTAIDSATTVLDRDLLTSVLPWVQSGVLAPALRRRLEASDIDVDDVREQLRTRLGAAEVATVELRRITPANLVMVVFGIVAANAIVSQVSRVGLDSLTAQLGSASVGWLVVAFLLRLAGYFTAVLSLRAVVDTEIPVGPAAMLQSAKSFVGLAVPSTIGRVAMDARFLQKLGASPAVALTQGPLISLVGFLIEAALLFATVGAVDEVIGDRDLTAPSIGGLIVIALGIAAVGIVVILAVERIRRTVLPFIVEAWRATRTVLTSPNRLVRLVGGELADRLVGALTLAAVLIAFGAYGGLTFPAVVFTFVGVGLLAGVAPVPGGIGVSEALLTGLLTAIGVESDLAFAVAITYRMLTAYLPPILGFFALRWLTAHGFL